MKSSLTRFLFYDNQMHGLLVEMTGMTRLYKAWKELNYGNIVTGFSLSTDKKRVLNTIQKRFTGTGHLAGKILYRSGLVSQESGNQQIERGVYKWLNHLPYIN